MKLLDLKNSKGKYPHLLSKTTVYDDQRKPRVCTYTYWVPDGIPFKVFTEEKHTIHQTMRQSLGEMHPMQVIPIDGHKIAFRVILKGLEPEYKFEPRKYNDENPLVFPMGQSLEGHVSFKICDATSNLLIGGAIGTGKTYCERIMILHLLLHPVPVDVYLIDLKNGAELYMFENHPKVQMFARLVGEALSLLREIQMIMLKRFDMFHELGISHIDLYNKDHTPKLRHLVIFIDEFAEFSAKNKDCNVILKDLLRRSRVAGIHLVCATQHPTVEVVDSQIKANMTARLALLTASQSESQTILTHSGAEDLPGKGRGILRTPGNHETEFQGYYLEADEIEQLVQYKPMKKLKAIDTKGVYEK